MASNYPNDYDSFKTWQDYVDIISASIINNIQDAVVAIEQELGKNPSGDYETVKERLDNITVVTKGKWQRLPSYPSPGREGPVGIGLDNTFYLFGGWDGSNQVAACYKFNVNNGYWEQIADLPSGRSNLAIAAMNGKIYLIGGDTASGYIQDCLEYDPATDTYSNKAPLPDYGRARLTAIAFNDKIYVFGGVKSGPTYLADCLEYDPSTVTWTYKASMPNPPRAWLACSKDDTYIYLFGGYDGSKSILDVDRYDPSTNSWTSLNDMPKPERHAVAAQRIGSKIYIATGKVKNGYTTLTQEYDPATDTWKDLLSCPLDFDNPAHGVINNELYIAAGWGINGALRDFFKYTP